ncbi:MAG: GntR family transcriptional regulator [Proteobacteria bacterium]|nr:GntR family transcriptional regulator [Pseudomonadota bacterium]
MQASSSHIADRVVEAILARRIAPGMRLGEQQLATIFGVSRTVVREALTRLSERGVITVSTRRGWYVIEPSLADAEQAFAARRIVELGLLRATQDVDAATVTRLRAHIARERAALRGDDVGLRSFLLGDFHVCLAECLGNGLLADVLRDLTARTTLIAMLYQSTHDAADSCAEHVEIVDALARGDHEHASALMEAHIGHVQQGLRRETTVDPLTQLRDALAPVGASSAPPNPSPRRRGPRHASARPPRSQTRPSKEPA